MAVFAMPAMGTSVASMEAESSRNSIPPLRTWDITSVSVPSWLAGNSRTSNRPPVRSLTRASASVSRMLTGCIGA